MMVQMHHGHEVLPFIVITSLFEFLNSTTEFFVSFFEMKENPFSIYRLLSRPLPIPLSLFRIDLAHALE
jgi:hypothetical protein